MRHQLTRSHVMALIEHGPDCWPYRGKLNSRGYGFQSIAGIASLVHRLAWEDASGEPIPPRMFVCHVCDVPACCRNDGALGTYWANGADHPRYGHLWLGTRADNMADMVAKGRARHNAEWWRDHPDGPRPHGEAHFRARLTADDVRVIRELRAQGALQRVIAARFGISRSHAAAIGMGRGWRHVT